MLLNRIEYVLMNNPVRAVVQRHVEARRLLRMGGPMPGGRVLEIGCGRGVGAQIILDLFRADMVHAFDLDPRMIHVAHKRLAPHRSHSRVWVGDATAIAAPDSTYDAVFDFGIIHHIPHWRLALGEIRRVLKPGGYLFAEEILAPAVRLSRPFLKHPQDDRFDANDFRAALDEAGFESIASRELWRFFAWFVAARPAAASPESPERLICCSKQTLG